MKWSPSLALAMALVAGAPAATAQDLDNSNEMWAKFYEKLTAVIKQGNKDPNMVVSLCVPGTPLVDLKQSEVNDVSYVNDLLALAPTFNNVWTQSNVPVADIYKTILDKHQVLPVPPLTADEKTKLTNAQDTASGDRIQAYENWKLRYEIAAAKVAEEKLNDFAKKNGSGSRFVATPQAEAALSSAKRGWETPFDTKYTWEGQPESGGDRLNVEKALSAIRELQARDPTTWWSELDKKFANGTINDTYMVQTFPPLDLWASGKGWVKFSYQASDKMDESSLSERDIKAAASIKSGGFHLDAKFAMSNSLAKAFGSDKSLKITMEMKRVNFRRPWLDAQVFYNKKWQWSPGSGMTISDGQGGGVLPMLPGSLIIVRNVLFEAKAFEKSSEFSQSSLDASASGGYGPFSFSASYSQKNKSAKVHAKRVQGGVEIPEPQIIGYVSTIVPKCPDPTGK